MRWTSIPYVKAVMGGCYVGVAQDAVVLILETLPFSVEFVNDALASLLKVLAR